MRTKIILFLLIAAIGGLAVSLRNFSSNDKLPIPLKLSPDGRTAAYQIAGYILHHEGKRLNLGTDSPLSVNPPGVLLHLQSTLPIPAQDTPLAEARVRAYWTYAKQAYEIPYYTNRISESELLSLLTQATLEGLELICQEPR